VMGLATYKMLDIPDGRVESTWENKLKIIAEIRAYKPRIVLVPYWIDRHPDHENASQLVRASAYLAGLKKIETVEEAFRPVKVVFCQSRFEFAPSFIVDITDEYDQRMQAVRAFKSQFYNPDNRERETTLSSPEFLEMLRTRCEYYGDRIGRKYGEPFFSPTPIGVSDFDALII
jgi:bacillithiol biosynthesis deacetylase BshB1